MYASDAIYNYFPLPLVGFYRHHKIFAVLHQLCENDATSYVRGTPEHGHRILYRFWQITDFP